MPVVDSRGEATARATAGATPPTPPEWRVSAQRIGYPAALAAMAERVESVRAGTARELVWLLEHPPLYTAGPRARPADLLTPDRFPVHPTPRGGQHTYHGPGQRVAYLMLDLRRRRPDLRLFVRCVEQWVIDALAGFGVRGERRDGRVGIWVVRRDGSEAKIAAVGVRVKGWVTSHGVAINVAPDLSHFAGIVPCGIAEHGVTSLRDLGLEVDLPTFDEALRDRFDAAFAPLAPSDAPGVAA